MCIFARLKIPLFITFLFASLLNGVFVDHFKPREELIQLLTLAGMDETKQDMDEINVWAQKNFLRKGERWEAKDHKFEILGPRMKPLLERLGFFQAVNPKWNDYLGALVLGATLSTTKARINNLLEKWNQGVRFKDLYFLTGERDIDPLIEHFDEIQTTRTDLPKTECEMIRWLWNHLDIPKELLQQVQVHFVCAPSKRNPQTGEKMRPTTEDTIKEWLKNGPPTGRYLAISNAPYILRQDLILKMLAPVEYELDTIGDEVSDSLKMAIILDELARLIYQFKLKKDTEDLM